MKKITIILILFFIMKQAIPQLRTFTTREISPEKEIKTSAISSYQQNQASTSMNIPGDFNEATPIQSALLNNNNQAYLYPVVADVGKDSEYSRYFFSDFDGDGKDELIWMESFYKYAVVFNRNISNINEIYSQRFNLIGEFSPDERFIFGRFSPNAGKNILVYNSQNNSFFSHQSNQSNPFTFVKPYQIISNWSSSREFYSGDFNGDGYTDLLTWDRTSNQWQVALYSSQNSPGYLIPGGIWLKNWAQSSQMRCLVGDYNGDKKDDIALLHEPSGEWWVALSTGSSFQASSGYKNNVWLKPWPAWPVGQQYHLYALDMNKDGLCDLLYYNEKERSFQAILSNGRYFDYQMKKEILDNSISNISQILVGKFEGNAIIAGIHLIENNNLNLSSFSPSRLKKTISLYITNYKR